MALGMGSRWGVSAEMRKSRFLIMLNCIGSYLFAGGWMESQMVSPRCSTSRELLETPCPIVRHGVPDKYRKHTQIPRFCLPKVVICELDR